jgi:hypothetical protein
MRHSPTISCTVPSIRPSFWSPVSPEQEPIEEKDVEEEKEGVEEGGSIMGSVDWREREVDTVDWGACGVSTTGSSVGAIS